MSDDPAPVDMQRGVRVYPAADGGGGGGRGVEHKDLEAGTIGGHSSRSNDFAMPKPTGPLPPIAKRPPRRKSELRRSGTVALNRMASQSAASGAHAPGEHHRMTMDERMAKSLGKTKASGIVSTRTIAGMAAFKKANLLDDPNSVIHQPLAVQAEFRAKITLAFIAQMSVMFAVMMICLYTPMINEVILAFEPVHALVFIIVSPTLLGMVFCIKYHPPYSQIAMIMWTVFNGFVCAVMQHKVINGNGMYQMMAMGLLGLIVSAAIGQVKVGPPDNRRLFTSVGAGGIASLVILVVSGGLQAAEVWGGGWGVWIVSTGIACTVTLWIS
jgi:hypothetical protein